ncbi:hypothetical protein [Trichothermofontia sp.]
MNTLTSPASRNGAGSTVQNRAWLTLTVKQFFGTVNWDDQPLVVQELKRTSIQTGDPLSLTLTVSQFMNAIPWDGKAIAAPVVLEEATPIADVQEQDLTVDDFSNLF